MLAFVIVYNWSPMLRHTLICAAILFALTGCGQAPDASPAVAGRPDPLQLVQNDRRPEITSQQIAKDVVGKKIAISELNGKDPDDEWTFEASEFRQVNILEKSTANGGLTLVIFMTTRGDPQPDEPQMHVSGKLELHYEWKAGHWILATLRNLTFRYTVGVPT